MGIERDEITSCYTVVRGVITNAGRFEGCAPWVPFLYDAIAECRFDSSVQEGRRPTVYWFELRTTDVIDTLEWPELTGIRRIGIWEDATGHVCEERVPWIGNQPPGSTRDGAPFKFGDYVTIGRAVGPFRADEVLVVESCICIAEVGARKVWRAYVEAANRPAKGWVDANALDRYGGERPEERDHA
jgi:hypothetical protein